MRPRPLDDPRGFYGTLPLTVTRAEGDATRLDLHGDRWRITVYADWTYVDARGEIHESSSPGAAVNVGQLPGADIVDFQLTERGEISSLHLSNGGVVVLMYRATQGNRVSVDWHESSPAWFHRWLHRRRAHERERT